MAKSFKSQNSNISLKNTPLAGVFIAYLAINLVAKSRIFQLKSVKLRVYPYLA
jgi:hypothetical protein